MGTDPEEIERLVAREPDNEYHKYIRAELRRVLKIGNRSTWPGRS